MGHFIYCRYHVLIFNFYPIITGVWLNPGDDTVYGGDGNDVVLTGPGNDTIYGEKGHDTLQSVNKNGSHLLDGGEDTDFCVPESKNVKTVYKNCEITS